MRFAVGLPNVGDTGDPRTLVALAHEAEATGWGGVFVWDHVAYRERGWPVADPYVAVTAIAATTSRLRIGVLVSALARRRPHKFAREAASLDLLSGGRLVVGAGLGSLAHEEFAAFGEDPDPRVRAERLDEALAICAALWSGDAVSFRGAHHRVDDALFLPRPVQRPRPPVWIAGRWPAKPPFRRAARWDGVFPTFAGVAHDGMPTPSALAEAVAFTRAERADGSGPFDVVLEGQTSGRDADADADAERIAPYADAGLTWWIEKLGGFRGPLDATRRRIAAGPPRSPLRDSSAG